MPTECERNNSTTTTQTQTPTTTTTAAVAAAQKAATSEMEAYQRTFDMSDETHPMKSKSQTSFDDSPTMDTTPTNGLKGTSTNNGGDSSKKTSLISPDPTSYVTKARVTRPIPPPPSSNPMQFVQIKPCNLYQTAQEQLKKAEEVKKIKEIKKEEPEDWQNNLDNWKSSRRKRVEHIIDRVVEVKKLELEEHDRSRRKSKTFSEMIEERGERAGGQRRTKLTSLAVYNEDESNDLSDLGIGTSSASGKSSLSEDYDNNSVTSDNAELDKALALAQGENTHHKSNLQTTMREYISSPGYETSSSTAPASSPDPCEYTYEGAIQDYKERISRAGSGGGIGGVGYKIANNGSNNINNHSQTNGNGATSKPPPPNTLNLMKQTTKSEHTHDDNTDQQQYAARRGQKIEDRLLSFEITSPSAAMQNAEDGAEKIKVDVPKIDISKRKEIFESQNQQQQNQSVASSSNGNVNANAGPPPPRVNLRDRFITSPPSSTDEQHQQQQQSPTNPKSKDIKRLSGDMTSIRQRLQSLEQQKKEGLMSGLNSRSVDIPVPPLKDRLFCLQNAVKKEEIKKPPVALIDERQLEIMRKEEESAKQRMQQQNVVEKTTPQKQTTSSNELDDSGIQTILNDDAAAEELRLRQTQEAQLNAAIAALALEEKQLEEAANAVNQIEAQFNNELSADVVTKATTTTATPAVSSSGNSSNTNQTQQLPYEMDFSVSATNNSPNLRNSSSSSGGGSTGSGLDNGASSIVIGGGDETPRSSLNSNCSNYSNASQETVIAVDDISNNKLSTSNPAVKLQRKASNEMVHHRNLLKMFKETFKNDIELDEGVEDELKTQTKPSTPILSPTSPTKITERTIEKPAAKTLIPLAPLKPSALGPTTPLITTPITLEIDFENPIEVTPTKPVAALRSAFESSTPATSLSPNTPLITSPIVLETDFEHSIEITPTKPVSALRSAFESSTPATSLSPTTPLITSPIVLETDVENSIEVTPTKPVSALRSAFESSTPANSFKPVEKPFELDENKPKTSLKTLKSAFEPLSPKPTTPCSPNPQTPFVNPPQSPSMIPRAMGSHFKPPSSPKTVVRSLPKSTTATANDSPSQSPLMPRKPLSNFSINGRVEIFNSKTMLDANQNAKTTQQHEKQIPKKPYLPHLPNQTSSSTTMNSQIAASMPLNHIELPTTKDLIIDEPQIKKPTSASIQAPHKQTKQPTTAAAVIESHQQQQQPNDKQNLTTHTEIVMCAPPVTIVNPDELPKPNTVKALSNSFAQDALNNSSSSYSSAIPASVRGGVGVMGKAMHSPQPSPKPLPRTRIPHSTPPQSPIAAKRNLPLSSDLTDCVRRAAATPSSTMSQLEKFKPFSSNEAEDEKKLSIVSNVSSNFSESSLPGGPFETNVIVHSPPENISRTNSIPKPNFSKPPPSKSLAYNENPLKPNASLTRKIESPSEMPALVICTPNESSLFKMSSTSPAASPTSPKKAIIEPSTEEDVAICSSFLSRLVPKSPHCWRKAEPEPEPPVRQQTVEEVLCEKVDVRKLPAHDQVPWTAYQEVTADEIKRCDNFNEETKPKSPNSKPTSPILAARAAHSKALIDTCEKIIAEERAASNQIKSSMSSSPKSTPQMTRKSKIPKPIQCCIGSPTTDTLTLKKNKNNNESKKPQTPHPATNSGSDQAEPEADDENVLVGRLHVVETEIKVTTTTPPTSPKLEKSDKFDKNYKTTTQSKGVKNTIFDFLKKNFGHHEQPTAESNTPKCESEGFVNVTKIDVNEDLVKVDEIRKIENSKFYLPSKDDEKVEETETPPPLPKSPAPVNIEITRRITTDEIKEETNPDNLEFSQELSDLLDDELNKLSQENNSQNLAK